MVFSFLRGDWRIPQKRVLLPACMVDKIRRRFPSKDGIYRGFMESWINFFSEMIPYSKFAKICDLEKEKLWNKMMEQERERQNEEKNEDSDDMFASDPPSSQRSPSKEWNLYLSNWLYWALYEMFYFCESSLSGSQPRHDDDFKTYENKSTKIVCFIFQEISKMLSPQKMTSQ